MATRTRRTAAKLVGTRLAEKYVAVIRGRLRHVGRERRPCTEVVDGADKRETFRGGKFWARARFVRGATVTLRAGSARGPILERVRLAGHGARVEWRQAFET